MNKRRFLASALLPALAAGLGPSLARAQAYPSKPIRIIASSAPGGTVDLLSRLLALKFPAALGQPTIVENKAGASGYIGTEYVARQPADGHTLLVVASSHSTNHLLNPKLTVDPVRDFAPISLLTTNYFVVAVPSASPVNSMKELIALARQKPGGLSYSTPGVGQGAHLGMELLRTMGGFNAVHVPFTGTGPATVALLGGQVDVSLLTPTGAMQHLKSGKLKVLAVTSSRRSASLPNVPTVAEAGFPGYELTGWIGLLAPAGTPPEIVRRLQREAANALKQPDVLAQLEAVESEPVGSTPEQFAAFMKDDVARWEKLIKQAGVKGE
ncbi:MAG TPA: tripartite tricarboxylate transporter substrate binding protein [Ramlibacter sp.]|nr:tripartite tricarboxylate transporter substrate binding protein [Ramlibacter sp.]